MIATKFYLDRRAVSADAPAPLRLVITKKGVRALISLNVSLLPSQWDEIAQKVVLHPQKRFLNAFIQERKLTVDQAVMKMVVTGEAAPLSATQIKNRVLDVLNPKESEAESLRRGGFAAAFDEFMMLKSGRTREIYMGTWKAIGKFAGGKADSLAFEDVSADWLRRFDSYLSETSPARNARNIHLRNIRAVFNFAIDEEKTALYPFRKFKIRNEATRKRALCVDVLRELFSMEVEDHMEQYRDVFKLVFLLIGVNMVDLCGVKSLSDGRLVYRRAKTGRLYSIKVEPEALEIIKKYQGKDWLLDIRDRYKDYRDYTKRLNMNLKRIGEVHRVGRGGRKIISPLFPDLTLYWARHSWATIAASLDIPKETIAAALGHGGNTVTDIYIDFDRRKVDEANRRVIDWVLYGIQ